MKVIEIHEDDTARAPEVPTDERLEVRSADGTPLDVDVMLHCWILPDDERSRAEIMRLHGTLGDGRHLWSFSLTPPRVSRPEP